MKKLILLLSAAGLITVASYAQSTADIVGFSRVPAMPDGQYEMISFTHFMGTNEDIKVQDTIKHLTDYNTSTEWDSADKLYLWDNHTQKYIIYGLFVDYFDNTYFGWADPLDECWENWTGPFSIQLTNTLGRGIGVWYVTAPSSEKTPRIIVSGSVYTNDSTNIDLEEGFNMIAYPYSASISFTSNIISGVTGSPEWETSDRIQLWDPNTQKFVEYAYFVGYDGAVGWANSLDECWENWTGPIDTVPPVLDMGKGFWYLSLSNKQISLQKIYN